MNQGTYPLAAAMINQLNRVDTISNNLANANTNGFKQEGLSEGSFNHYLTKSEEEGFTPTKINTIINSIPKIDGKYISTEQGPLVSTANALDFALKHPNTFFQVLTKEGEVQYTRDGAFKNLDGMLVDSNGSNVLGSGGEPIVVEEDFSALIGVLKIDTKNLEKVGNNNYKVKEFSEIEIIEENETFVLHGALEKSNVNSVSAMVALIEAHRRFEQAQKGLKSIDEINAKVIDGIGRGK